MKPGGICVWVVQDACIKGSRSGTSFKTVVDWMDIGWKLWDTLLYYRRGVWNHAKRFRTDHEYMFCFMKPSKDGKPLCFNRAPLDVPNPSAGKTWKGGSFRKKDGTTAPPSVWVAKEMKCRGTIFNYNFGGDGSKLKHEHPAVYPDVLPYDMIECFCPPDGVVLDPFNGSGTTAVAAKSLGRNYIGIDISEEYIEIARKRLETETISRKEMKLPDYDRSEKKLQKDMEDDERIRLAYEAGFKAGAESKSTDLTQFFEE